MNVVERFQKTFTFNWGVGTIEFGAGKIADLGDIVKSMNASKALVVTDKGLVEAGILAEITPILDAAGIDYTVFDEIEPNPIDTTTDKGGLLAKEIKADLVIGLGGGSPIDSSKAIALLATNPGSIRDYQIKSEEDFQKLKIHPLPLITVPTTSG